MRKYCEILFICLFLTSTIYSCSQVELQEESDTKQTIATINKIAQELDADIKIDSTISVSNAIIINSEEEYRDFIKKAKKKIQKEDEFNLKSLYNKSSNNFCNSTMEMTGAETGYASLKFYLRISGCMVTVEGGGFEGWTLGISYTLKYAITHCGYGEAHGLYNYNLFYEGLGTVFSEPVTHYLAPECVFLL